MMIILTKNLRGQGFVLGEGAAAPTYPPVAPPLALDLYFQSIQK